jgi:DNA-binding Lrp family transcriptional regulator
MDEIDRAIVNGLQGGFPLCTRPYRVAAEQLHITEEALLSRLTKLLENRTLTRFGPMFDAERLGGAFTLCAMSVPAADFERVAALVNAHPEVAHNYERGHAYNMWFVLATGSPRDIDSVVSAIQAETGYPVVNLPRESEYFVELRLVA